MESSKITEDESTVTPETLAASDESVSLAILFETGDEKVVETNDGNVDGSLSDLSNAVGEAGLVESSSQMEITYETASGEKAEVSGNVAVPMEVVDTGDLYSVGAAPEGDVEEVIYLDSEVVKDMPLVDMQESNGVEDIESEQIEEQIVKNIETASKTKFVKASQNKRPAPTPTYISRDDVTPVRPTYLSREDVKTRFLCPVCQKSFRQKHLLLCHIKLHDPAKPKSSSVYMSNCTTCGGNVRLTSEQARLLQERGTEDARIICSTCKLLGHDGTQKHSAPIELKPAYNFNCDICSCDIKLTDDQLQLVDKKGPENIRIICAPCSVKDQELVSAEQVKPQETNVECTICHRVMTSENTTNAICAECKTTNDDEISIEENYYTYNCSMCYKEMYIAEDPRHGAEIVCAECKTKQKYLLSSSRVGAVKAVRDFSTSGTKVDGLAVMYKCNNCFCSMQVSEEQKELLRTKGVSGMKIICSACNAKEKIRPPLRKKLRTYQCDVCLNDMDINYVPSRDDDDIICQTCCKAEQRSRSKNVKNNVLKCVTCNITLSVPPAQVKKLMETQGGRLKVKCDACKDDTKVSTGESIDYRCDICNVSFGESFSKFSGHFSAYHLPVNEPDWGKYGKDENRVRCPVCDASFKSRAALLSHIKSHKPPKKKILARPCPSCSENHGKAAMFEHYKLVHNVNVESETFYFDTMEDFKLWKEDVERSTCSKFLSGGKAKIDPKRPSFMGTLKCHWCVLYKSKLMSVQKTIFCPAKMALYEDKKGGYNVEFTKTHVGHDVLSAEYSSDEIDRIVDLLKADRSIDEIINDLSKDYPQDSPEYSKIYQLQNDDQFSLSLKLGNVELIKKFRKRDFVDEEFTSGSEGEVVDLPDCLSWVDESILTPNTVTVEAVDAALVFRHTDVDVPLAARKLDVLRRLTAVLNKCSVPEHLDIIDVYLDPCEQTLIEFTSGKQVEVVEDDPPQVDAVSKEGSDVEPPEKRSKID